MVEIVGTQRGIVGTQRGIVCTFIGIIGKTTIDIIDLIKMIDIIET